MLIGFTILTHLVQLLTIVFCIYYLLKKNTSWPYRFFSAGWILVLAHDLTMVVIGLFKASNNTWVYNIAFPVEQMFMMYFFILLLENKKLFAFMILFGLFAILNFINGQGRLHLNTYSLALGGIIILLLAFYKLYSLYKTDSQKNLYREPAFWVCTGFIIYWGMATPFYALYNFLWQTAPQFFTVYYYSLVFGLSILLNLCILKALQCSMQTQK
jgi:hypothetical protein